MNEEFNKFLDETKVENKSDLDAVLTPSAPSKETAPEEGEQQLPEKDEQAFKNRRHRRLEAQITREREGRIAAEARAQALAEYGAAKTGETDPLLLELYGSEERGKQAAAVHQKLLETYSQRAEEKALQRFEATQAQKEAEVREFESHLDNEFETLEDSYKLDLTSNAPAARKARNEMLEILEKISPKDDQGNITEYADMEGVYEMWSLRREKAKGVSARRIETASRSMESGDVTSPKEKEPTPGFFGWRKDYGL